MIRGTHAPRPPQVQRPTHRRPASLRLRAGSRDQGGGKPCGPAPCSPAALDGAAARSPPLCTALPAGVTETYAYVPSSLAWCAIVARGAALGARKSVESVYAGQWRGAGEQPRAADNHAAVCNKLRARAHDPTLRHRGLSVLPCSQHSAQSKGCCSRTMTWAAPGLRCCCCTPTACTGARSSLWCAAGVAAAAHAARRRTARGDVWYHPHVLTPSRWTRAWRNASTASPSTRRVRAPARRRQTARK